MTRVRLSLREAVMAGYRSPVPVAVVAILFLVASPFVIRGLRVETDLGRLLGTDEPLARSYLANKEAFGETDHLVIAVECGGAAGPACDSFVDHLTSTLRAWPDIRYVESPHAPSRVALVMVRVWQRSPDYPIAVARAQLLLTRREPDEATP